jgi:predicted dehydrogenase
MTTEPLRWGLIGSGQIASAFADDLTLTDSGRVVAIGSRSQESADRFADKFDIPNRHASYEALVADPAVEVVYVGTPHHTRCTPPTRCSRSKRASRCWWRSRSP